MLVSLFSLSLSLSLSWYAEYKKLMNFEVFPKPFPSFAMKRKISQKINLFLQTKNRPQNKKRKTTTKKVLRKKRRESASERDSKYVVVVIIIARV